MNHTLSMDREISIIYEDNHILVVVKPVNIPVQADDSGDLDFLTILKDDLKIRYNKPGNVFLGLVHRLDRPVGGAMVFAKTSKAASRLSEAIRSRAFHKTYFAVIHGKLPQQQGRLVHYLLKNERTNTVSSVTKSALGAKQAILDYQLLKESDGLSLAHVVLHTGRSHQIRVQFAAIGCPLFGDQKYGADYNQIGQQIALWSKGISFEHPTTKQNVAFYSTPPEVAPWTIWDQKIYMKTME